MLISSLIVYALAMAGAALAARRVRPDWGMFRIVALTNLPAPLCVLVAAGIGAASVGPAARGETDASGMMIAVFMLGGMFLASAMVALGMSAGAAALYLARGRRARREDSNSPPSRT